MAPACGKQTSKFCVGMTPNVDHIQNAAVNHGLRADGIVIETLELDAAIQAQLGRDLDTAQRQFAGLDFGLAVFRAE